MTLAERFLKARKAKRLSQSDLARLLKVTRNAVSLWEAGKAQPKSNTMQKAAVILDVGFDWLATGRGEESVLVDGLPLVGEIAAGVWHEVGESQEMEFRRVPVAPDPRYPREAQYALQIRGNSVNKVAADGTVVICVDMLAAGLDPRDGDLVAVERKRGSLVEATLKRVRKGPKGLELWPESDDPAHQEKLTVQPAKGDAEVTIKGLVIYILKSVARGG